MAHPATNSFFDLASRFQQTKIAAGQTEAGIAYKTAKGELKTAFTVHQIQKPGTRMSIFRTHNLANDNFADPLAIEKAAKKFEEWVLKKPQVGSESKSFENACADFERAFLASRESRPVMAARAAKKEFKQATFERLEGGATVEALEEELTGLSDKTLAKISYWAAKHQSMHPII